MISKLDYLMKRVVAYPLVAVGYILTEIAQAMIQVGAWLIDVDTKEETQDENV